MPAAEKPVDKLCSAGIENQTSNPYKSIFGYKSFPWAVVYSECKTVIKKKIYYAACYCTYGSRDHRRKEEPFEHNEAHDKVRQTGCL
jgi:hypothetical protein